MKIIIFMSIAFASIYLSGCATKQVINKPIHKKVQKIQKQKKTVPLKKDIHNTNKMYKKVIESNVAKKSRIDSAEKKYEKRKSTLLKQLQVMRDKLSKDKNSTKYLKEKEKILNELKFAQEELDKVKKKNKIVNYTQKNKEML
jgi:outer membrane murein-binding lipoprotein Lpp